MTEREELSSHAAWSQATAASARNAERAARRAEAAEEAAAQARAEATRKRERAAEQQKEPWTPERVRALGLSTDVETAGEILGIGRSKSYRADQRPPRR